MGASLVLTGLHAGYGRTEILHGVSLTVDGGDILAIIGANGAGKSTLLKSVAGLADRQAGSICVDGVDITSLQSRDAVRIGVCLVLQRASVFGSLTVAENLMLGGRAKNDPKRARRNLEQMYERFPDLRDNRQRKARVLSGGQRRLVEIARALMADPEILLLDEPTIGLAPNVVAEVFSHIKAINQSGTTVVMVEQNVKSALQVAARVAILERGLIRREASAEHLAGDSEFRSTYLTGKATTA